MKNSTAYRAIVNIEQVTHKVERRGRWAGCGDGRGLRFFSRKKIPLALSDRERERKYIHTVD